MAEHKDKKSFIAEGIPEYEEDAMQHGLHGIKKSKPGEKKRLREEKSKKRAAPWSEERAGINIKKQ